MGTKIVPMDPTSHHVVSIGMMKFYYITIDKGLLVHGMNWEIACKMQRLYRKFHPAYIGDYSW